MAKRKDKQGSAEQPASKRTRNCAGKFREARNPSVVSNASETTSQITTLVVTPHRRLRGKREHRNHSLTPPSLDSPEACNPAPDLMDATSIHGDIDSTQSDKCSPRNNNVHAKLEEWLSLRDASLDEILRHDGLGDFLDNTTCFVCKEAAGIFKCRDCCGGGRLRCRSCIVRMHQDVPLHRIEKWTGDFFDKDSLRNIGLHVQLGHGGNPCPSPLPGPPTFTVFDTSGYHIVAVDYCACPRDVPIDKRTQLLRHGWFPATFSQPNTVFTFDCLDTFHELTLQGKGNAFDFYHLLLRKTDNANLFNTVYRYKEFHRVFRIWRNLMTLKRAGCGHDPAGIANTPAGGVTVECPACPQPNRNLPNGWESAGSLLYLYLLYISVDANFKLKGKQRDLKDVELLPGWGMYVEESKYQKFLSDYIDQPEINTCESEHDAIAKAQVRCTPGYAVSGNGLALCSRHSLIRRNGAGDLQKGERYCNMDFIILSALVGITLPRVIITYDIGCQWSKNLMTHMAKFPEHMRLSPETKIDIAIPSWHINAHGEKCRRDFYLGYTLGAGRTCGEEVEVSWSHTNPLAPSVREMGPAARHETLDDHWNGWNFRKIVGFRMLFAKRFREAAAMSTKHETVFKEVSATFSTKTISKWLRMIEKWEIDPAKVPNPYQEPEKVTTIQDVCLKIARDEGLRIAAGEVPRHKVTTIGFFNMGFDIEDQQFKLKRELSTSKKVTSKQLVDLQEKRNALVHRFQAWRPVQLAYMPHVSSLIPGLDDDTAPEYYANPESITVLFPSSLTCELLALPGVRGLAQQECQLRESQANDALADIRRLRRIIQGFWHFKKVNVSGTGNRPNTRMLGSYKQIDYKLQWAVHRYRTAYSALLVLDPDGSWMEQLKELRREDIRGPSRDPDDPLDNKLSKGRFEASWIWRVPRSSESSEIAGSQTEEEFNESMRAEWAQTRARMCRWQEELKIVQEEMRRVLAFFQWRSSWWLEQASRRKATDPSVESGLSAYAHKQAAICLRMATRFAQYWLPILGKHGIDPEWSMQYKSTVTPEVEAEVSELMEEQDWDCEGDDDDRSGSIDIHETLSDAYY
ncbi:hypothetical protein F5887DRAFT_892104 [Amanita rubescens]|nr:hypothetical protein F5887DRAFT_892104 [Amanita rubescens]